MSTYKGENDKSVLSSSSTSSSTSDDSGSSSDSDSSSAPSTAAAATVLAQSQPPAPPPPPPMVAAAVQEELQELSTQEKQQAQFSVTSSDSAGLRMKIAFPRNQQPSNSRDSTSNNNNGEKKRLTTKKLIPQQYSNKNSNSNADDRSGTDSDSSCCSNASRGGSTSSGDGTDSSESDSSDETLQEINPADLDAVLPNVTSASNSTASPAVQRAAPGGKATYSSTTLPAEDNNSSSDMELPNIVNDVIRRIERGSDTETSSTKTVPPSIQYTSSLLQDYVAKTQMMTSAPPPVAPAKSEPKKRGRPRSIQQPSTSNGPQILTSESPDSGILSTVSPAPSPRDAAATKGLGEGKKGQLKYSLSALEKSTYATERTLYPPRRKRPGRPPKEPKKQEDNLDPLWKKIDLSKKFREPCLDGYKSDGGQSICCSKRLAAQSGYVSDYYSGSRGRLSGYKSDHSTKSRLSGYRSDVSRTKSCGYRSDCSTRHRKKVRRKRRKKIGITSKSLVDELSDILQLSALTLGTSSSTSSSRGSISAAEPESPPSPPKKGEKIPLQTFNGLLNASKPKFGSSTVTLGQAAAFGKKLTIKQSNKLPLSRANVQKNNEELSKRKSTKDLLSLSEHINTPVASPSPPPPPKSLKSIDGRSMKSRRTTRHDKCRRMSTMSRASSRSTVSRHHFKHRRRRRLKSRSMSVADKIKDAKIATEIEQLSESLKQLCQIHMDKAVKAVPAKRGPKKRKQSEVAEPKRRTKKTLTQSPDDHKLPLKKRHYLLTNGEKGTDDDGKKNDLKETHIIEAIEAAVTGSPARADKVSPKKRLLASTAADKKAEAATKKKNEPSPSPEAKIVTKKLRSDPSNFKSATPEHVPTETKEPKKPGRKPKAVTAQAVDKKGKPLESPSKSKTGKESQSARTSVINSTQSPPPPGIFEPTVDLELQIPVSTISAIVGKADFSPPTKLPKTPAREKVVEKLLNKTGGHLLLKRKRRRANRTGFPSKKPKKKRSGDLMEGDKSEEMLCDRVPIDGEPATSFVQRQPGRRPGKLTNVAKQKTGKPPLQDANADGKDPSTETRKREREKSEEKETPQKSGKRTKNDVVENPNVTRLKHPRDVSSDSEPLINFVRTSDRIKSQEKNKDKENKATMKKKDTPVAEVKRRKLDENKPEFPGRLTVSIERIPGLRFPSKKPQPSTPSVTSEPHKPEERRSRLDKLTQEFNQKFAVVKLKSLDDIYCNTSRSTMIDMPKRRERSKSVGRGLLSKSAEEPQEVQKRYEALITERAKTVARTLPQPYVGVQPAEVLMKNIIENRTRSRAKSVAPSPDREKTPERTTRAKSVARHFGVDEDVAKKRVETPTKKPKKIPETSTEEVVEVIASSAEDIEDLIPAKRVQRKKKEAEVDDIPVPPNEDPLEHDVLPPSKKAPILADDVRHGRKKYLVAGIFSDFYKEDPKNRSQSASSTLISGIPAPPYCDNYYRHRITHFQLPFDIWQQFDAGKLNRSEIVASWNFKKLRVNAYGDVKQDKIVKANEQQICSCKPGYDCAENCLNRLVYTECRGELCPCGDKCKNTKIQRHDWAPGLEKFMTENKGWGVRCKLPIRKSQFISEYLGEVVTESKFKERMQTLYVSDNHHYCLNLDKGLVIDGHRMGSDCRFVNHSCAPNCEIQKWSVNGLPRMCLFALKDIEPYDELTYDYNFALYNPAEGQPCKCGATNCRGVIGGKSQRVKTTTTEGTASEDKRANRPRKRQAKKNQPLIPIKYGLLLPAFVPPTDHERTVITKFHCFLMRNLRKVRRNNSILPPVAATSHPPASCSPTPTRTLSIPMAAVRTPRNMRTRGLAIFEDNPELEKSARLAVVLRGICEEIHAHKTETDPSPISKLMLPSKKKCALYYERVPCPIDLAQIEVNVEKGMYDVPKLFNEDMLKLFGNAIKYYGIHSPEGVAATELNAFYKTVKAKAVEKLEVILGDKELVDGFIIDPTPAPQGKRKKNDQPEDIIRCICGLYRDEGLMIQCSRCMVWQHIECTKADTNVENYVCEKCDNRVVDYEIKLNEFTEEGYQYYLSLMRGDLQVRQGDAVYVLRDIPMTPDKNKPDGTIRKHNYQTIGEVDFSQCDIFRIESLWKDDSGKRFAYGHHYLRPRETFHEPTRKFYPNEILRSPLYEVVPIELIMGRCWVLDPNTFCKGRPVDSSEPHVYICELRVDKSASTFAKISKHQYPVCTKSYAFHQFETKLKIAKTFAPHELNDVPVPKEKKKQKSQHPKEDHLVAGKPAPIIQILPPLPKTFTEKRTRLEGVLGRLMVTLVKTNQKAVPPIDASYMLTVRGARSQKRRTNVSTPIPDIK